MLKRTYWGRGRSLLLLLVVQIPIYLIRVCHWSKLSMCTVDFRFAFRYSKNWQVSRDMGKICTG